MIEPFYFGSEPQRLFGVYHPPQKAKMRRVGVVLCCPVGQEYIRTHRAFLHLAKLLAGHGFSVLRFDYYGCGDSMGECGRGTPRQWVADISQAIEELGGCGVAQTVLIGLRFGATLALVCGAERGDIEALVLWEPVVEGAAYLGELDDLHNAWLVGSFAKPKPSCEQETVGEALGFPITESMRAECHRCDLRTVARRPAKRVLIVDSDNSVRCRDLAEHLEKTGAEVNHKHMRCPRIWQKSNDVNSKGLVPTDVLQYMGTWMSEVFS